MNIKDIFNKHKKQQANATPAVQLIIKTLEEDIKRMLDNNLKERNTIYDKFNKELDIELSKVTEVTGENDLNDFFTNLRNVSPDLHCIISAYIKREIVYGWIRAYEVVIE